MVSGVVKNIECVRWKSGRSGEQGGKETKIREQA